MHTMEGDFNMKMKSALKLFVAVLVGFVLGAWVFHTPVAKAQSAGPDLETVLVPSGENDVVGFSCVQIGGEPKCFVAETTSHRK